MVCPRYPTVWDGKPCAISAETSHSFRFIDPSRGVEFWKRWRARALAQKEPLVIGSFCFFGVLFLFCLLVLRTSRVFVMLAAWPYWFAVSR